MVRLLLLLSLLLLLLLLLLLVVYVGRRVCECMCVGRVEGREGGSGVGGGKGRRFESKLLESFIIMNI